MTVFRIYPIFYIQILGLTHSQGLHCGRYVGILNHMCASCNAMSWAPGSLPNVFSRSPLGWPARVLSKTHLNQPHILWPSFLLPNSPVMNSTSNIFFPSPAAIFHYMSSHFNSKYLCKLLLVSFCRWGKWNSGSLNHSTEYNTASKIVFQNKVNYVGKILKNH